MRRLKEYTRLYHTDKEHVLESSSAPALAASDLNDDNNSQSIASLSVSERTGLEEARAAYEKADKALAKAQKDRDAAEKALNEKKAVRTK